MRAAMPPTTPPAIAPVFLCGCETDAPAAGDVAAAVGVAMEVVELGPVGGGRRVGLEDDCNFEDFVVEDVVEIELELEDDGLELELKPEEAEGVEEAAARA